MTQKTLTEKFTDILNEKQQPNERKQMLSILIYGYHLKNFVPQYNATENVTLYLHERNPEILIAQHPVSKPAMFDLKRLKIDKSRNNLEKNHPLLSKRHNQYLILQDSEDEIILLFESMQQRDLFFQRMQEIIKVVSQALQEIDSIVLKSFIKADTNNNHLISQQEIKRMFQQIKLNDTNQISQILNYIKYETKFADFTYKDFQLIAKILRCKVRLIKIFEDLAKFQLDSYELFLQQQMVKKDFEYFLQKIQGESQEDSKRIANTVFKDRKKMSFYHFCLYVESPENSITSLDYFNYETETNKPIFKYICHSSHNTYLTGNQLYSQSRAQRYYQDLDAGIRCVQIDCHDGVNEPIVNHAFTATSKITFKDVIKNIQKFRKDWKSRKQNDQKKHSPIILSLENHCNAENQKQMSKIMKEQFGDSILKISEIKQLSDIFLDKLYGRVIIKCSGTLDKYQSMIQGQVYLPSFEQQDPNLQSAQRQSEKSEVKYEINKSQEPQQFKNARKEFEKKKTLWSENKKQFERIMESIGKTHSGSEKKQQKGQQKLQYQQPTMSNKDLLQITFMLGKGTLGKPIIYESVSLGEEKILQIYSKDKTKLTMHSQRGWLRSYPSATRISSTNYNPMPSIEVGVQILALNTQTVDYYTCLMRKYFQRGMNNVIGYREIPNVSFNNKKQTKVFLTPLSAEKIYHNDMQKKMQMPVCQVKMRLFCYREDIKSNQKYISEQAFSENIINNAFNPIFQETSTMIVKVTRPDLAFVAVQIEGTGIAVIPIEGIKNGYRYVTLCDNEFNLKDSRILFQVQVDEVSK